MPNGNELIDAMEFESQLRDLKGDDLSRFIARQLYNYCEIAEDSTKRIRILENRNNKFAGALGGASGVVGAAIVALVDYFTKRG